MPPKKPRATPREPEPEARQPGGVPWSGIAIAFGILALTFLIGVLTIFMMSNNDIWIHLKTGEQILTTWSVPDKDPYSFTASDHDYVAHEWLSGVVFYLVYAAWGVNGLIFFKSAVLFLTCVALYFTCRFLRVPHAVIFPVFTLMLFTASARFLERPHIFTYLFMALYLLCYFGYRERGRNRIWLYAIPLLHIVWTNMHGGHFQGIFLLVMLGLAEIVMYVRSHRLGLRTDDALPVRDVVLIAALPFASLAAAFVNPYGYRLLTFPFELTGQDVFMKSIYEWQPAIAPAFNGSAMYLYYVPWIAVLFGTFLFVRGHDGLKKGWRDTATMANVILIALYVLFVIEFANVYKTQTITLLERHTGLWYFAVAAFLLANAHRLEFAHAGIAALMFALSMRHNRGVTDAVVATVPTLGHNIASVLARLKGIRTSETPEAPLPIAAWGAVMLILGSLTMSNGYYFSYAPVSLREDGLGIASNMPVGAVDYIVRNRISGRCFPNYNAAALLINRMWPDVLVAMDSRNDVYGEAIYEEYMAAVINRNGELAPYLEKWQPDFMLLNLGSERSPPFQRWISESPAWHLVYFDDRFVVYVTDRPHFAELIQRDTYHLIDPLAPGTRTIPEQDATEWLVEAERAVRNAPNSWTALQYKGKTLFLLSRLDEAEATFRKILEVAPRGTWFPWVDIGAIYLQRNQPDKAAAAFETCLSLSPGQPVCRQYLDRARAGLRR